jgi:hypothetical protein
MSDLSSCVDDLGEEGLTFVNNLMAESVFNRRIITLDEMAFAILDSEGRFACATGLVSSMNCACQPKASIRHTN